MTARLEGDDEELSLARAAERLGWKGSTQARYRRMKRSLERRERNGKKLFIIRGIGENGGPTYHVTMRLLRRYCREFFVRGADEIAHDFKEFLESNDERSDARVSLFFGPKIEELTAV